MKKKNKVLLGGIAVLVAVLAVLLLVLFNPFKSDEEKVSLKIQSVGDIFYKDFFYPQQVLGLSDAEIAQKMTALSVNGIRINLQEVSKISEIKDRVADTVNEVTNEGSQLVCNPMSTYIIITPKQPFGIGDYTITIDLDCK